MKVAMFIFVLLVIGVMFGLVLGAVLASGKIAELEDQLRRNQGIK